MNCPENQYNFYPPHPGGSRGVGGQNFKSAGNFTNCRENRNNIFFNPHPTLSDGGGGRGGNFKVTRHQVLKSISGMQLSWAKPGNPRECRRQGRIGERREGREEDIGRGRASRAKPGNQLV